MLLAYLSVYSTAVAADRMSSGQADKDPRKHQLSEASKSPVHWHLAASIWQAVFDSGELQNISLMQHISVTDPPIMHSQWFAATNAQISLYL